jgi:RNA polymerase sigma-70 factor (ECF subfamily)
MSDWESVYRDNVTWVYRLMLAKAGNQPDAEDLTAEVFLSALRSLRTNASTPEIRAYLLACARTVLAAHWRKTFGIEITTISDVEAEELADERDDGIPSTAPERLDAILAELPERYRTILRLRFLRAYSVRDVATELGVTVANAKVLQHRALRLAAKVAARMEERA